MENLNIKKLNIKKILFIIIILILFYIIFKVFFNNNNFTNTETIIYNFSSSYCGHCKQFQPIWDEFANSVKDYKNINAINIKCDNSENDAMCEMYNIQGYPTIIIENNNNKQMYNGERTIAGLYNALNLYISIAFLLPLF
jgi:thiol-disulfide isomerase/thioredoxin